jgi:hypothetical protein
MGSGQSSVQVSEEGFHALAESLSGIVVTNSSSTTSTDAQIQQQQRLLSFATLANYYRVQGGLYPGSGKMMRTYRIIENRTLTTNNNNTTSGNFNTRFGGGGGAATTITTTAAQQQQIRQKHEQSHSAAVVKAGWILCKNENILNDNSSASTAAPSSSLSKSTITHSVVPSLQEHSNELQRIRDVCIRTKQVHVVPYIRWFAGNEMKNIPTVSGRNANVSGPAPPVALAPIVTLPVSSSAAASASTTASSASSSQQQQGQQNQLQQYLLKPIQP